MTRYIVTLTLDERAYLSSIASKGKHSSQTVLNALILLGCDEGDYQPYRCTNESLSRVLNISMRKIDRVKKRFVFDGLDDALTKRKPDRIYSKKIDGDLEAKLIALSCNEPPEGHVRWTLRLLADKAVELEYIDAISHKSVRQVLKKNELKPWRNESWIIPPGQNSTFIAHMEQVLDVYKRPWDPRHPIICMDESPKQLIGETREPIPCSPGKTAKYDFEYRRCGTCNIFLACEPLAGKRMVKITERRTKQDWARFLQEIAEEYSDADKITLVMDNLNTHAPGSFYETYPPEEAKELWDRFEFVYTPKHGSWLNIAEIELRVLYGQCLNRRIKDINRLRTEVKAWEEYRNNKIARVMWRFTKDDARIKLVRLYPTFEE
ncbi:IS630 family transposase [Methanofollis formosanus]|uniref:IS630 family transposase n=1 Tax=Methanofollis formosanus TaxID=299308 RepID=A0A8G1EGI5_9EURY|nr:IS630 family transposase [Methanofollis formosanus]QYZ79830.1 IS630 family transposase [Methanofollis formosanus]